MDNQVFYSNIGRFSTAVNLLKLLGFTCIRMENNKLAYKYSGSVVQGQLHPLFQIAYDELRTALAKNKGMNMDKEGADQFLVEEFSSQEQVRVEC